MRLTCPNCEAQYEVPDEVIPASGRDVQCSNCGDTWFTPHPDHIPEDADIIEKNASWDVEPEPEPTPPEPDPEAETVEPEPEAEDTLPRRELDPAVKDVLREEAEREQAAREQDSGLETQPDLGLDARDDELEKRNREAQARMARLRGEPEGAAEDADSNPDPGTRRNLLPDIDEINSSLSSDDGAGATSAMDSEDVEMPVPRKSGFRRGFMTILLLAVIGLLVYIFAPQLADSIPALKDSLMSYTALVDQGRAWLDGQVGGLMGTLDGMSSEDN